MENIKQEYEKLRKKYNLPSFEIIDNEFEISTFKNNEFLLRQIRRKINEKLANLCKTLEGILYPNVNSIINAYEARDLSDEEKTSLFKLYRELMIFERKSFALDIESNDKIEADFILEIFKKWPKLKEEFLKLAKKMQKNWENEEDFFKEGYIG